MAKIKTVYTAGAITPYPTEHPVLGFLANLRRGQRMAKDLFLKGYAPFCPFLDFIYFLHLEDGETITEKQIKELSMVWLERCDAVLVLPRYRKSAGTKAEIARAKELNIPVFYSVEDLLDYEEANGNTNRTQAGDSGNEQPDRATAG